MNLAAPIGKEYLICFFYPRFIDKTLETRDSSISCIGPQTSSAIFNNLGYCQKRYSKFLDRRCKPHSI